MFGKASIGKIGKGQEISSVSRFLIILFVCGCSLFGMFGNGYAQDSTMPLRSPLKIDPREGNLNLTISFAAGTDRMGSPIVDEIYYSSAVWNIDYEVINGQIQQYYRASTNFDTSRAGWSSSLDAPTINYAYDLYNDDGFLYNPCVEEGQPGGCPAPPRYFRYVKKYTVTIPGVGSHDLYKDQMTYQYDSENPYRDKSGVFYSVDGSRIKYDADIKTLYLPNGSHYVFEAQEGQVASYTDRHGNQRIYNKTGRFWTDALGRVYTNPFTDAISIPTQPTDQTYTVPGFNGGTSSYVLQWKKLADALADPNQQLKYTGDIHCRNNTNSLALPPGEALFTSAQPTSACANYDPQNTSQVARFNPIILAGVVLPNGAKYSFKYSLYGDIEKVEMPEGGYERYEYATQQQLRYDSYCSNPYQKILYRQVWKKIVSPSGQGGDELTTIIHSNGLNATGFTFPDGTAQFVNTHYVDTGMVCYNESSRAFTPFGFVDIRKSLRTVEESKTISSNYQLLKRTLTDTSAISKTYPRSIDNDPYPPYYTATRDPRTEGQIEAVFEPNEAKALVALVRYEYESNVDTPTFSHLNVTKVKTYDYVAVDRNIAETADYNTLVAYFNGILPRTTQETEYLHSAGYEVRNMTNLPTVTRVRDKNGTIVAQSEIKYDEPTYAILGYGGSPTGWVDPQTAYRGNVTTTRSWSDVAANQYVESHAQYDQFGNLRKTWDGRNNVSEIEYTDNYADGISRNSYALPTRTISAIPGGNGSTTAFESTVKYDFNTGLPTAATDANGQTSQIEYNDPLLRPTKSIAPNGHQTITEYGAGTSAATRFVKVKTQIDDTKWKEGFSWYDGIGRTYKTQSVDSNGDVLGLTCYDQYGRMLKASNPFRNVSNPSCSSALEWTTNVYDEAGRVKEVVTPDGAKVQTNYGMATSGSQIGTVVTVKDQALKERRSIANAFGQLTRVDEPTAGGLGAISTPNQPTYYEYDTLSNLTKVKQGGTETAPEQTRSFVYDSLSRLKSATNPESGLIQYQYDNNGNLILKTDARGVYTNYNYDALNRVTSRGYQNEPGGQTPTPAVYYFYDGIYYDQYDQPQTATGAVKGKLTSVSSSVSRTNYEAFDIMGRVTQSRQITDGENYQTGYIYNLSGALIEETYPSGRVVKNTLDADGMLQQVRSKKANDTFRNYANSFNYTAAGGVSSMRLGNGKWENTTFNSRLQPVQIGLGNSATDQGSLKLNFDYGGTSNNGNVLSQTITTPTTGSTTGFTAIQTYTYDELNRLKSARENIDGNVADAWKQTFKYDRYGNRNFDTTNTGDTTTLGSCPTAVCNPTVDPATNKLIGYTFDAAGNTKIDASGKTFTYDAENKQTLVKNAGNQIIGEYFYDGDGKRVKKISGSEVTIFIYDASGKMVAEYSTTVTPQAQARISYLTNDHLGSPRITTDAGGNVFSRRDFLPFGEEIDSTATWQRSVNLNYGEDGLRQKFTSYERDNETQLDYAKARMHDFNHGRFTSPDPIMMSKARLLDPQSINLYVYARNNPLKFVDPNGEQYKGTDGNAVIIEKVDGKWVIRGDNASKDLIRLVGLVNNSGSSTANRQFQRLNAHKTMINFAFGDKDTEGRALGKIALGRHQPHGTGTKGALKFENGKFEGTANIEGTKGNEYYVEATITIFEGEYEPDGSGDSVEDRMVATFGHEAEHDLDPNQVQETERNSGNDDIYHPKNPNWKPPMALEQKWTASSPYGVGYQIRDEIREHRRQELRNTMFRNCPPGHQCF